MHFVPASWITSSFTPARPCCAQRNGVDGLSLRPRRRRGSQARSGTWESGIGFSAVGLNTAEAPCQGLGRAKKKHGQATLCDLAKQFLAATSNGQMRPAVNYTAATPAWVLPVALVYRSSRGLRSDDVTRLYPTSRNKSTKKVSFRIYSFWPSLQPSSRSSFRIASRSSRSFTTARAQPLLPPCASFR